MLGRHGTGRCCSSTRAQLEGMACCLLRDLAHLALSHLPTEWSHGLPFSGRSQGLSCPMKRLRERKKG